MNRLAKRLPSRRRSGRLIGRFPSGKSQEPLPFESRLELDALRVLEMDPDVTVMQTQPLQLTYLDGMKLRRYIPDIQVWGTKDYVIEVKPSNKADTEEFKRIVEVRRSYFAEKGLGYEVWTEREIRARPRYDRVITLWRYLDHEIPRKATLRALLHVRTKSTPTLGGVIDALGGDSSALRNAYALVAQGIIRTDVCAELNRRAHVLEVMR